MTWTPTTQQAVKEALEKLATMNLDPDEAGQWASENSTEWVMVLPYQMQHIAKQALELIRQEEEK